MLELIMNHGSWSDDSGAWIDVVATLILALAFFVTMIAMVAHTKVE